MPTTRFIEWKDSYSVGIDEFDLELKRIIEIINDLYYSIRDQTTDSELVGLLSRLFYCTETHFVQEERLLQEHGYPDLVIHRAAHRRLTTSLKELQARALHEESDTALEAMHLLRDWWIVHVLVMDQQSKPYLMDEEPESQL